MLEFLEALQDFLYTLHQRRENPKSKAKAWFSLAVNLTIYVTLVIISIKRGTHDAAYYVVITMSGYFLFCLYGNIGGLVRIKRLKS